MGCVIEPVSNPASREWRPYRDSPDAMVALASSMIKGGGGGGGPLWLWEPQGRGRGGDVIATTLSASRENDSFESY